MAEALKASHGLLTFKIGFLALPGEPIVNYTLQHFADGELEFQQQWSVPLGQTGIPRELSNGSIPRFSLPDDVAIQLPPALEAVGAPPHQALWLHLVKPYGYLGALPWEGALAQICDRPVLRLPDFLEQPRENPHVLEVAVVWDISVDNETVGLLKAMIGAWLRVDRGLVRVHLFCRDPTVRDQLRRAFDASRFKIHEPPPITRSDGAASGMEPHFSMWLQRDLQETTLDALHVIASADFESDRSFLEFSARDANLLTFMAPEEIAGLLNRTGAWTFVGTGPADESCDVAVRQFTDALAQTRAGPAIYHPLNLQAIEGEFGPLCHLLFSPGPRDAPRLQNAFVYLQPALVSEGQGVLPEAVVPGLSQNEELLTLDWATDESPAPAQAPTWVASVQRVVEDIGLECTRDAARDNLLRDLVSDVSGIADQLKGQRREDIVQNTIDDIQAIVRRHALSEFRGFDDERVES